MKIPKSAALNMAMRKRVLERGFREPEYAESLKHECRRDPIFFINLFLWIIEARDQAEWEQSRKYGEARILPFITRPYQDRVISESIPHLGKKDLIVWKSREMGISLLYLALALWDVIFNEYTLIGFVSKDEDTAASTKNPNSLLSMFLFMLESVPLWLRPTHQLNVADNAINFENGSNITAYAATGNFVRGGRRRWILMDEFHFFAPGEDEAADAASTDATNCRVVVSTSNMARGESGSFYSMIQNPHHNGVLITLDWWEDQEKSIGLYHSTPIGITDRYNLEIDDAKFWRQFKNGNGTYKHPTEKDATYEFILDGKKRSLYFDWRCRRPNATPEQVESEIGRSFGTGTACPFDREAISRAAMVAKKPTAHAELMPHLEREGEWFFNYGMTGNSTFWCQMEGDNPPYDQYACGIDTGMGNGGAQTSYTVITMVNRRTCEQVFEWRSNKVYPQHVAHIAVWLCRKFHDALMIPEAMGPGQHLIQEVAKIGYRNTWMRMSEDRFDRKLREQIGYFHTDGAQFAMTKLAIAIKSGKAKINSKIALHEMTQYVLRPDGKGITHTGAVQSRDASARGQAHGDSAIALSMAWLGVEERPSSEVQQKEEVNPYSYEGRRLRSNERLRKSGQRSYWQPTG